MDCTIRDKLLYCSKLFEKAPAEDTEIQDARSCFEKWYDDFTARREGTASLDERVRDPPDVQESILQFLDALVLLLEYDTGQSPDANNLLKRNEVLDFLVDRATSFKPSLVMHKIVGCLELTSSLVQIPASVDMYEEAKNVNVDHFFPTDKGHIEERFPKADPELQDRLLQAVLSRRRFLQYAQERKEMLAKEAPSPQDEEREEKLFAEEKSEFEDTVATQFSPDNFTDGIVPTGISDIDSDGAASDASDSSSLCSDMSTRVPPMPPTDQEGKPFECPCCFSMIEAKNRAEWKRHVLSDMCPYVCTFTDCKEPDRLFASRHVWYSHELAFHRRMWICIEGCSEQFDSESAFKAHLSVAHREFKDIAQAEKRGAHSRRLPEPEISTCPMCCEEIRYPELVMTHIGRHQAQLGLWALRGMRYFDDEDGAKMSNKEDKVPDNPAPSQDAAGSDSDSLPPGSTSVTLQDSLLSNTTLRLAL